MKSSLKYYGQFDPPVDKVIHERYFPNKTYGISLEAGAFDGILENSTKFFEENYGWTSFNIEPLPHIFDKLMINRPNSFNFPMALSNADGEEDITVYNIKTYGIDNTNASLKHTDKHRTLLESISQGEKETFTVQYMTYRDFIECAGIKHLDLFVLDVEGYEPEVIDGMVSCEVMPDVFVIEHGHRQPDFFVEKLKVLDVKYKLDFISHVNSYFVKV